MSPYLVLLTVLFYFLLLIGISYLTGRKADNQSFFTGNRKSRWYVVAFGMIGSAISGVTFVSVPGMVGEKSFSYMQMVLGFAVGQFIIAFVLIPLFYRMNLTSIYEYLEKRFGISSYKTGALFFFISKLLGAAVRLFLVCIVLQFLLFAPLGIPFLWNVVITVGVVWLFTRKGGVKSVVWTDSLKTLCLIISVGACIYFIAKDLGLDWSGITQTIRQSEMSQLFFFDDINDKRYFFKQFLAGVFTVIATTGLDQDMMQKVLSCKSPADSQKNMIISGVMQIFINLLFLMVGVMLFTYAVREQIPLPAKSDELFPLIATGGYFPPIVGVIFTFGLIAAAFAAAGSAMTALTTSFSIDLLNVKNQEQDKIAKTRNKVHILIAVLMAAVIIIINLLNNTSVIDAVYILASYTYGPILGIFAFGIFTKKNVRDRYVPLVAILSPLICFIIDKNSSAWFNGYQFSYELLIMNAAVTFIGLVCLIRKNEVKTV